MFRLSDGIRKARVLGPIPASSFWGIGLCAVFPKGSGFSDGLRMTARNIGFTAGRTHPAFSIFPGYVGATAELDIHRIYSQLEWSKATSECSWKDYDDSGFASIMMRMLTTEDRGSEQFFAKGAPAQCKMGNANDSEEAILTKTLTSDRH